MARGNRPPLRKTHLGNLLRGPAPEHRPGWVPASASPRPRVDLRGAPHTWPDPPRRDRGRKPASRGPGSAAASREFVPSSGGCPAGKRPQRLRPRRGRDRRRDRNRRRGLGDRRPVASGADAGSEAPAPTLRGPDPGRPVLRGRISDTPPPPLASSRKRSACSRSIVTESPSMSRGRRFSSGMSIARFPGRDFPGALHDMASPGGSPATKCSRARPAHHFPGKRPARGVRRSRFPRPAPGAPWGLSTPHSSIRKSSN